MELFLIIQICSNPFHAIKYKTFPERYRTAGVRFRTPAFQ
jgi:hypothetical protein